MSLPWWLYIWINSFIRIFTIWVGANIFLPDIQRRFRLSVSLLISIGGSILMGGVPSLFFIQGDFGTINFVFLYLSYYLFGGLLCMITYRLTLFKAIYTFITVILLVQCYSRLSRLACTLFDFLPGSVLYLLPQIFTSIPICLLSWLVIGRKMKNDDAFHPEKEYVILFSVMVATVLLISLLEEPIYDRFFPNVLPYAFLLVGESFFSFLSMFMQYWFYLNSRKQLEVRLQQESEKKQLAYYQKIERNIDEMNIRIHDLKHQMLRIGEKVIMSSDVMKEINESFKDYKTIIQTGDRRIDIILSEKQDAIKNESIRFFYSFDGSKFGDFSLMELNRLFGNAMDNAITYLKTTDREKRFLKIVSEDYGGCYKIQIVNCFEGSLKFGHNNLPKTTKKDSFCHGHGLTSIQEVLKEHGGNMTVEIKDGTFVLSMIFPILKKDK